MEGSVRQERAGRDREENVRRRKGRVRGAGQYEVVVDFALPHVRALDARNHVDTGSELVLDQLAGKGVGGLPKHTASNVVDS